MQRSVVETHCATEDGTFRLLLREGTTAACFVHARSRNPSRRNGGPRWHTAGLHPRPNGRSTRARARSTPGSIFLADDFLEGGGRGPRV